MSERPTEILLFAPDLIGQSLAMQLTIANENIRFIRNQEELTNNPSLIIWFLESIEFPSAIEIELRKLEEYWHPSPVLLLLPSQLNLSTEELLQFGCAGLLQDPAFSTLNEAVSTLLNGGRVIRLKDAKINPKAFQNEPIGLGHWLLISGIQQINRDIQSIDQLIDYESTNSIHQLLIQGRRRELNAAKGILIKLWGPLITVRSHSIVSTGNYEESNYSINAEHLTLLTLRDRNSTEIWEVISERIKEKVNSLDLDGSGILLALEALNELRRKNLLLSIHKQLDIVIKRLIKENTGDTSLGSLWISLQDEIQKESLRSMIGNYVRMCLKKELVPLGETLISMTDLTIQDEELPHPKDMLDSLIKSKTLNINGQLLPPDDPRSLMHLEELLSNWLIRTSEIISAELLNTCAKWPEIRHFLLKPELISTRELERLRNQINSKNRWFNLIDKPINIYESKRLLYKFNNNNKISKSFITEPRDDELTNLDWWQQQVALLVEARDALAPQVQLFVKKIGDLMVVLLTNILGRSIGLIGRGIAQGMGRTLRRG